jgi:hypothetical protein
MPERGQRGRPDVVKGDMNPAVEKSQDFSPQNQALSSPRTRPYLIWVCQESLLAWLFGGWVA